MTLCKHIVQMFTFFEGSFTWPQHILSHLIKVTAIPQEQYVPKQNWGQRYSYRSKHYCYYGNSRILAWSLQHVLRFTRHFITCTEHDAPAGRSNEAIKRNYDWIEVYKSFYDRNYIRFEICYWCDCSRSIVNLFTIRMLATTQTNIRS